MAINVSATFQVFRVGDDGEEAGGEARGSLLLLLLETALLRLSAAQWAPLVPKACGSTSWLSWLLGVADRKEREKLRAERSERRRERRENLLSSLSNLLLSPTQKQQWRISRLVEPPIASQL